MFKKKDLKQNTILGISAMIFVAAIYALSLIDRHLK